MNDSVYQFKKFFSVKNSAKTRGSITNERFLPASQNDADCITALSSFLIDLLKYFLTYPLDFDGEILKFSLETVVILLKTCSLGECCLQLCLSIQQLGTKLLLEFFDLLRSDAALAALELLLPAGRIGVGLLEKTLKISAATLFLLEEVTCLLEIGRQVASLGLNLLSDAQLLLKSTLGVLKRLGESLLGLGELVEL